MKKNHQEISEIQVTGNQYSNYAIEQTSASLRTNTSLLRTAQNIQIVSKQVLQDQQLTDMLEGVTRNTSGAMLIEHWGNFARISMRGFKLPAFRNGMNVEPGWSGFPQ